MWQCWQESVIATTAKGRIVIGVYWVEAMNTAKHLIVDRTGPPSPTKNHIAKNFSDAEIEKPCCTLVICVLLCKLTLVKNKNHVHYVFIKKKKRVLVSFQVFLF